LKALHQSDLSLCEAALEDQSTGQWPTHRLNKTMIWWLCHH